MPFNWIFKSCDAVIVSILANGIVYCKYIYIIYISTLFYCSFLSISLLQIQIHFSVCLSKVDLLPWFGDHASACASIPRIRRITWTFETMQTVTASVFGWWRVGSRRAVVGSQCCDGDFVALRICLAILKRKHNSRSDFINSGFELAGCSKR